jgi:hypothetical protein
MLRVHKKGTSVFSATLKEAVRSQSDQALRNIARGAEHVKVEICDVTEGLRLSQWSTAPMNEAARASAMILAHEVGNIIKEIDADIKRNERRSGRRTTSRAREIARTPQALRQALALTVAPKKGAAGGADGLRVRSRTRPSPTSF